MIKDLVSVIIPCYNVAPFLRRCLDSVLNNTYQNLQVICINDGSTDNTLQILESYNDERIKIISHENKGLSLTRNVGMESAEGEFISFIDSDDWVHREFYERMVKTQKESHADVVICNYKTIYDYCVDEKIQEANYKTVRFLDVYDDSMLYNAVWNKLYRADILKETRFVPVFAEDNVFNSALFISHKDMTCSIIDAEIYYYFQRSDSLMHRFHEDRILALAREFYNISQLTEDQELKTKFMTRGFKLGLSTRYKTMFRENLRSYRKECNKFLNEVLDKMTGIPFTTKCTYMLCAKFPSFYRWFRNRQDPTLKIWEQSEIESQKTA